MSKMKRITVFCGASNGNNPLFLSQAFQLGKMLAENDIELVYGGAKIGLMGAVANGVLAHNGKVTGVLPAFLKSKEIMHDYLSELILVDSMHSRKTKMFELCDGIIALPGGFGTMEELLEMLTWAQLGLHQKPVAIFNVDGYFDSFITFINKMVDCDLLNTENSKMLLIANNIYDLLPIMNSYVAPNVKKWVDKNML
jgi:uncharacterized protein (TIGR00730 family)